jgi:vanillate O-demethylase monooxygenase subunit
MQTATIAPPASSKAPAQFPRDQWYVAGFASELTDKPLGRTFLGRPRWKTDAVIARCPCRAGR